MPARLLTQDMGTGIYGKLPTAGDFVARGLPSGVRNPLDSWLTSQIVPMVLTATGWPEGGVRAAIVLAQTPWLLLIEPSEDAVGRRYPLVACTPLDNADQAAADAWADAVWPMLLRGTEGSQSTDAIFAGYAAISVPKAKSEALVPPLVWWPGMTPVVPTEQLLRLAQISSG